MDYWDWTILNAARCQLARAFMNEGIDWNEACDQVVLFEKNLGSCTARSIADAMHLEAYRYEDM